MDCVFDRINNIVKINKKQYENLVKYVDFLIDYNNKLNLIGKSTIDDIWERHIIDSLQIINLINDKNASAADLGSGAGLPGIPLSIVGIKNITLFEKSVKKCQFLNQAKQFSNNKIIVKNENLYDVHGINFDIIVSRALANLNLLLNFSYNLKNKKTELIFLKGKKIYEELDEAQKYWKMEYKLFDSITSSDGKIIKITNFEKIKK